MQIHQNYFVLMGLKLCSPPFFTESSSVVFLLFLLSFLTFPLFETPTYIPVGRWMSNAIDLSVALNFLCLLFSLSSPLLIHHRLINQMKMKIKGMSWVRNRNAFADKKKHSRTSATASSNSSLWMRRKKKQLIRGMVGFVKLKNKKKVYENFDKAENDEVDWDK